MTVIRIFDLNGIISEVDVEIAEIFGAEKFWAGSDVALIVPEIFGDSSDGDHKHVGSDVKLSVLVEQ